MPEQEPAQEPEEEEPLRVELGLEDASIVDVARILEHLTGAAVAIGPSLEPAAPCLGVSLESVGPIPLERAVARLAEALEGAGVRLTRGEGGYLLEDTRPESRGACAPEELRERPAPPQAAELGEPSSAAVPARPPPPPRPAQIRVAADGSYELDRDELHRIISTVASGAETARVIPHEEGGQVIGLRLYGIRRGALFDALGLRNGDLILTINGYTIHDPERALEAYAALRDADHYEVALRRGGQPMLLRYRILEPAAPAP